jgi:signal transduction histidine kinase
LEGAKKWLEVSVSRMDDDHLIHIFTDVTSIKEAQFSVQRSAERLSTIINTSHAGFFMGVPERDEKGEIVDFRFTLVNEVLASFVGETRENLVGQLGSHRFVKYKTNGLFDQFRKTYLANTKKQFDFYYKGENVEVWGNLMVTRIEDELLGTFTDFTNVKKLQLQLENMVGELKRSNASLEEFAYAASHDLQEPLRKIYTFSDRLQQELNGQLNSTQKMMFERIGNATMRMRNLIDDLLAYSEVGAQANANSIVNTNAIVDQVLQDLESLIQDTHTKITRSLLPPLRGDERQLRQLFQNLIGNAIKYHSPDREPVVSIVCHEINRHDALLAPHAQLSGKDAYLIEIIDNGIGFEQEQAEKIFQVFQRLHGRSEYQGTGVGLAIVQKVVQNHHGVVVAEGKPGKGATFRVFLPR